MATITKQLLRRNFLGQLNQLQARESSKSTVNQSHIEIFANQSESWWDMDKFYMLHTFNAIRGPFVQDCLLSTTLRPKDTEYSEKLPLKGYKLLDVGCGGGIFTECLAKLGADITGVDASPELISIALQHARLDKSLENNLRYEVSTIEKYSAENTNAFDAVVISEVIEHINEKDLFIKHCVKTVKKDGSIFITTFNKTFTAWFIGIFLYEDVFKYIPKGAHQTDMFIGTGDMSKLLKKYDCTTNTIKGAMYNPVTRKWSKTKNDKLFYLLHAIKK